jgi:hypothetical protein
VLGIAWFGGAILKARLKGKRYALLFMIVTGCVLFYMAPVHSWESWAFRVKMVLLAGALLEAFAFRCKTLSFICWTGMIFTARGIAFF